MVSLQASCPPLPTPASVNPDIHCPSSGSCPDHLSLASWTKPHLLILSIQKMPHCHFLQFSYQQLLVWDDEQTGVGSLHFGTGGQFNTLIGGLPGQSKQKREQKKKGTNVASTYRQNTQSCNKVFDWTYRDKCTTPDSGFDLDIVVSLDLNVFQDAFYILALCSFAVLLVKQKNNHFFTTCLIILGACTRYNSKGSASFRLLRMLH